MAKTILCFGDSNTYGAAVGARPDDRYGYDERWPGVLAGALGTRWRVIEEGLNGRTTVRDDPVEGEFRNGKVYLQPCLFSHKPIDVVAIMLGTNDLKARFNVSAHEVAEGIGSLINMVKATQVGPGASTPRVLVIAPPPFLPHLPLHADLFMGAYEKSMQYAARFAAVAENAGVDFLDAGWVTKCTAVDGFHLDAAGHVLLGRAVAKWVESLDAR